MYFAKSPTTLSIYNWGISASVNSYFALFTTHSYQFGKFGIFGTALIKVVVDCRKFANIRGVEFQKRAFFDNHIGHFWKGGPVSNPTLKILQKIL